MSPTPLKIWPVAAPRLVAVAAVIPHGTTSI